MSVLTHSNPPDRCVPKYALYVLVRITEFVQSIPIHGISVLFWYLFPIRLLNIEHRAWKLRTKSRGWVGVVVPASLLASVRYHHPRNGED